MKRVEQIYLVAKYIGTKVWNICTKRELWCCWPVYTRVTGDRLWEGRRINIILTNKVWTILWVETSIKLHFVDRTFLSLFGSISGSATISDTNPAIPLIIELYINLDQLCGSVTKCKSTDIEREDVLKIPVSTDGVVLRYTSCLLYTSDAADE